MKNIKKIAYYLTATLLFALSVNLFLLDNAIAAGGFAGIATVINTIQPISVGLFMFVLNIPFVILAAILKGKSYALQTLIVMTSFSVFADLLVFLPTITDNKLVAAIFGGMMYGVGTACIVKANVSAGGTDLWVKLLIIKFKDFSIGKMFLFVDGAIVLASMVVAKDIEAGLYAVIAIYTAATVSDKLIDTFQNAVSCTIVTGESADDIAKAIMHKLGRGVTCYHGYGMYQKESRNILVTVIRPHEVPSLKKLALEIDPHVFLTVGKISEVVGMGFDNYNQFNSNTIKYQKSLEKAKLDTQKKEENK